MVLGPSRPQWLLFILALLATASCTQQEVQPSPTEFTPVYGFVQLVLGGDDTPLDDIVHVMGVGACPGHDGELREIVLSGQQFLEMYPDTPVAWCGMHQAALLQKAGIASPHDPELEKLSHCRLCGDDNGR